MLLVYILSGQGEGINLAFAASGLVFVLGLLGLSIVGWLPFGRHKATSVAELNDENALPELRSLVFELSQALDVECPQRLHVMEELNAFASYHNGLPGVLRGDRKLAVGLTLLYALRPQYLVVILAHELSHLRDVGGMRVCALSYELEGVHGRMTGGMRRRLNESHKKGAMNMLSLLFIVVFETALRSVLNPFFSVAAKSRRTLLEEMEYRADMGAADLFGGASVVEAMESIEKLSFVDQQLRTRAFQEKRAIDNIHKETALRLRSLNGKKWKASIAVDSESLWSRRLDRLRELGDNKVVNSKWSSKSKIDSVKLDEIAKVILHNK